MYSRDVTAVVVGPAVLQVGQTVDFTATFHYSDGETATIDRSRSASVEWTSSNPVVAPVSPLGTVTARAVGSTTITATPSATSTGTGRRIAGSLFLKVE